MPAISLSNKPYLETQTTSGPALLTLKSKQDLSDHSGIPLEPGRGIAIFEMRDCNDMAGDGITFDPIRNEMFTAEKGAGAWLNNRRMRVSSTAKLEESLVASGFPSYKRHQNVNIHFYYQLAMITHGVRRGGSAAIDLAYTACGRLEGFWEFGLNPWDMAAGTLLVEEAGGIVSGMRGESLDLHGRYVLADNGSIHDELLAVFEEVFEGKYRNEMPGLPAPDWEPSRA